MPKAKTTRKPNVAMSGLELLKKATQPVTKVYKAYKTEYEKKNDEYLATPAGKKAKAVLKAGGGM